MCLNIEMRFYTNINLVQCIFSKINIIEGKDTDLFLVLVCIIVLRQEQNVICFFCDHILQYVCRIYKAIGLEKCVICS